MFKSLILLGSVSSVLGGTILWDGRFNDMTSSAALSDWSWSDQTGPYQYYIHGPGAVTSYVNLDSTFKNPADTGSTQGVKITLDSTAYWNGQTMRRTELIPSTTAAINKGTVYYHFSMQRTDVNPPSEEREHQIAFFESHFTEMKSGWQSGASGTSDPLLRWNANSATQWNATWEAGVWHNVAYGIDFDAGTVAFYHSTGADDLVLTVPAVKASVSSNGADWHLGVLELPRDGYADADEDIYFSGVYIETGELTIGVSGPGGASSGTGSSAVASSVVATPTTPISTSVAAPVTSSSVAAVEVPVSSSIAPVATPASEVVPSSSTPLVIETPISSSIIIPASTTFATVIVPSSTTPAVSTATSEPEEDDEDCEEFE